MEGWGEDLRMNSEAGGTSNSTVTHEYRGLRVV